MKVVNFMHCFVLTLLPTVITAGFLHNLRLYPGKGKGDENLKSKIKKEKRQTPKAQRIMKR